MQFKPTWSSFLGSAAYSLSPAFTAGIATFFLWENIRTIVLIASVLMGVLSLYLLLQDVFVHLHRLYLDDRMIAVVGPLVRQHVFWSEACGAVLKERENVVTRTDHLLIVRGQSSLALFNTSTLSRSDEEAVLAFVRSKVVLVVERSKRSF